MVSVAGRPCMEHIVELVRRHGMTQVVATLAYMPQIIRGYFGEGSQLGVEMDYSVEETPAGTAGSVKLVEHYLDETFLVISGDALTDIDLTGLLEFHKRSGSLATIALKHVPDPLEFGVVITAEDGRIIVNVHQRVRDLKGTMLTDRMVQHVYSISGSLIERMEIRE